MDVARVRGATLPREPLGVLQLLVGVAPHVVPQIGVVVLDGEPLLLVGVDQDAAVLLEEILLAVDDEERREILRWLLFDNHKLTSYTATYRFMRTFTNGADPAVLAEFRKRAEAAWGVLDAHLDSRRYVVGNRLTIADISLCGYLFWPEEIGVAWDRYPHLRDWLARIRDEPGWVHPYALMPGHPRPDAA